MVEMTVKLARTILSEQHKYPTEIIEIAHEVVRTDSKKRKTLGKNLFRRKHK